MIEKVFIFILFLGPLVFFHELGHFLFARFFGVRVEVFSIGFGPKLFKFKRGDTEYALSLIPLGGYVKMYGDDPLGMDKIPIDQQKYSFTFKSKWARFWIVFGGPLANFIMAYCIFFTLFLIGEKLPEIKMGVVPPTSSLYSFGLRTGDVLKKVNGKEIQNPSDIVLEGTMMNTLTVERSDDLITVTPNIPGESFFNEMIKFSPLLRRPIVISLKGELFGVSLNSREVDWSQSLDEIFEQKGEFNLYLFSLNKGQSLTEENIIELRKGRRVLSFSVKNSEEIFSSFESEGLYPIDLQVKSVKMKSPADLAGLRAGDIILGLDNKKVISFENLRNLLQKIEKSSVNVKIHSLGVIKTVNISPEKRKIGDKYVKLIGVYSSGVFQGLHFVDTESKGLVGSFLGSFGRTWETIVKTFFSFGKLITGQVSFKNIGGPLAIGKVASDSFNTSLSYFFQLMALISVNLGVINLFPIPVLDGGHIVFILIELINGGPISRKKVEIAQQVGLSLLLMLMIGSIYNDVVRFF